MGRFPEGAHRGFESIREGHFWFETRRRALASLVKGLSGGAGFRGLEVGCGDGFVLAALPGAFWAGADEGLSDALRARRQTGRPAVVASGESLPFRRGFGLVCAFDVVEHVERDAELVAALASALEPGGRLVLTVPAGPELWGAFDRYAGHYRRYTRASLESALAAAGLRAERIFPLFRLLWPLAWAKVRLGGARDVEDPGREYRVSAPLNAVLRGLLGLEERLLRGRNLGRGTSWCAVARRADEGEGTGRATRSSR